MLKKLNFYLIYIFLLFGICSVVTEQYENNTQVQEFNKTFDEVLLVKRNFKKRVNKEGILKKREREMKARMGK
jgi:hypothetical protein